MNHHANGIGKLVPLLAAGLLLLSGCELFDSLDPLTKVADIVQAGSAPGQTNQAYDLLCAKDGTLYVLDTVPAGTAYSIRLRLQAFASDGSFKAAIPLPAGIDGDLDSLQQTFTGYVRLAESSDGQIGVLCPEYAYDPTVGSLDGKWVLKWISAAGAVTATVKFSLDPAIGMGSIETALRSDGSLALWASILANEMPQSGDLTNQLLILAPGSSTPTVLRTDNYMGANAYNFWLDLCADDHGHLFGVTTGTLNSFDTKGSYDGYCWVKKDSMPDLWAQQSYIQHRLKAVAVDATGSVFTLVIFEKTGDTERTGQYLVKFDRGITNNGTVTKITGVPTLYSEMVADKKGYLYLAKRAGGLEKWDCSFQ